MNGQRLLANAGASGFRVKLLVAMMLVVSTTTAAVLYFAQRNAASADQRTLHNEFQGRLGFFLGAQELRLAAIAERCRTLARSVRIRAALEEGVIDDLYLNAAIELRDVLTKSGDDATEPYTRSLRARFFRFLNPAGQVVAAKGTDGSLAPWEAQLAIAGVPDSQQVGYLVAPTESGEVVHEVIATPIVASDTGEVIGAIVLGFEVGDFGVTNSATGIKSGIWLNGRLHLPRAPHLEIEALDEKVAAALRDGEPADGSAAVDVNGEPHLLFARKLNAGSRFPSASQVCLYPLAGSLARQRELRWKIITAGAILLLGGLGASHFTAGRLSAPVEQLAEDSALHLEQRERAEAALELTEQRYRGIFENAVEGIFLTTPEGRYLSANPALARIYGYDSPQQLIAGLTDINRQLYAQPGRRDEFLRLVHATGSVREFESEIHRRDGAIRWISEHARLIRDEESGAVHYEGMVLDITERKRAADELLAVNAELQTALANLKSTQEQIIQQERLRALGQMASGIAHDFNNALVPILGFCELLLLNPATLADRSKASKYLETIQTAAKDASSVVSRLREFYRPNKNDRVFAPVHLKRLVEQAITLTKPKWKDQAQAGGATIEVVLDLDAVPPVAGEESALREVLTNLIFNAVDAMPEGGTLTLRTRLNGDSATLEVSDTGTGMTEEVRLHCLEPFFSTKGERGTGLGLAMVFGIVQRHSGSLDLRSAPGQGTTFAITIPLMDAEPEAAPEKQRAKSDRSLRVLVVDDEQPVRDTLAAVLATEGHEVELATDGAEGLKRFIAGRFDLVLTDKAMPAMNGDQMAAAIKRVAPRTPIILLTGFGQFHDRTEFPDVDVLASKPIRVPALRDAIAAALEHV